MPAPSLVRTAQHVETSTMTDFTIYCSNDPDVQSVADYTATYGIRIGGDHVYRLDLYRRKGVVLSSRFETLAAGFLPFEINQTSGVGRRRIDVREAFAGAPIGVIRGLRLHFEGPNQIVGLHDPTPLARRIVRNALRGSPARFVFLRAVDRNAIGWIEAPPADRGPWPVRIVKGLRKPLAVEVATVWQGQLSATELDLRLFIAAAVLLHSDRGYGGA